MDKDQKQKLLSYIDDIKQMTRNLDIQWTEVNPQTFAWNNPEKKGRVVIQKISPYNIVIGGKVITKNNYVLQALDNLDRAQLVIKKENNEDEIFNTAIGELFELINKVKTESSLNFFESLIYSKSIPKR